MAEDLTGRATEYSPTGDAPRGVLLLHGLGGSSEWMLPWAEYLTEHGYRVSVPLMPGHGTTWQDLGRVRWTDWSNAADNALTELRRSCTNVAVAGLSMGGALALRVALERPDDVSAIVLVNPSIANPSKLLFALPVLQHIVPSISSGSSMIKKPGVTAPRYERTPLTAVQTMTRLWRDVRPRLPGLTQPMLLFRSVADGAGGELSSRIILAARPASECREILLQNSYHLATLDYDAPFIFAESAAFLAERMPAVLDPGQQVEIL